MIVAVIDTNVLVSGIYGYNQPTSVPAEILRLWRRNAFVLVVSNHILDELEQTLVKPFFASRLSRDVSEGMIEALRSGAQMTHEAKSFPGLATHAEDDKVLAAAVAAEVEYIVTGDTQLQRLGQAGSINVISPVEFLRLLEADK